MDALQPEIVELVDRIARTTALTPGQARRVVEDVLDALGERADDYVRRRHAELQRDGLRNEEIFARLGRELDARRFRAPALSDRQLRRIVYG